MASAPVTSGGAVKFTAGFVWLYRFRSRLSLSATTTERQTDVPPLEDPERPPVMEAAFVFKPHFKILAA